MCHSFIHLLACERKEGGNEGWGREWREIREGGMAGRNGRKLQWWERQDMGKQEASADRSTPRLTPTSFAYPSMLADWTSLHPLSPSSLPPSKKEGGNMEVLQIEPLMCITHINSNPRQSLIEEEKASASHGLPDGVQQQYHISYTFYILFDNQSRSL